MAGSEVGEGCLTVAGDALHPMTANMGQGGCIALEVLPPLLSSRRSSLSYECKAVWFDSAGQLPYHITPRIDTGSLHTP